MTRIVITGAGLATCLGLNRRAVWEAVEQGRCGTVPMSAIESPLPPGAVGGQAPPLPEDGSPREVRYLRHVLRDALIDAGFKSDPTGKFDLPYPAHRCGIVLGTTLHGMRAAGRFLRSGDLENLKQFLAPAICRAAAAGLGFAGPALNTCSACSSGLASIALAVTLLESGQLDLVAAGGYDPISEYVFAGFNSLRLIAAGSQRPFARDRDGMKTGEGYAIVILERADDAGRRRPGGVAQILGFGESADAHHLTQPHPEGEGAARAVQAALHSSQIPTDGVDLIAAHGTATPDNDAGEFACLRRVFAERLADIDVVAFKSHLSHTLAAAGAAELILSASALSSQTVPPCANVTAADSDYPGLKLASGAPRKRTLRTALNISLGFGGANACMVIAPVDTSHSAAPAPRRRDVYISGVGVVLPGSVGNTAFARRLREPWERITRDTPLIDESEIQSLLQARRVRRMSNYVKYSLAAATFALKDAAVSDPAAFGESCAAILGTTHGSVNYCHEYYEQIVRGGIAAANPMLFAEGVPNAAAAHLSLALGIKGGCQTLIGSRAAGLDALGLAAMRIASGHWDRAIVAAGEEYEPLTVKAYSHCGLHTDDDAAEPFARHGKFALGCGAVAVVLESQSSLESRGVSLDRVRGSVGKYSAVSCDLANQIPSTGLILAELDNPTTVLSSANGTWIDHAEAAALRQMAQRTGRNPIVSTLCGYMAEAFSVVPLASVAAVLLTGRAPAVFGHSPEGIALDKPSDPIDNFAALATDYSGPLSGVSLRINRRLSEI